jgi:hypothetical protein
MTGLASTSLPEEPHGFHLINVPQESYLAGC